MRFQSYSIAVAAFAAVLLAVAPATLAADITDVGFVDQQAIALVPRFAEGDRQLAAFKAGLDREFARAIKNKSEADRAKIAGTFQQRLAQKQRDVFGPLFVRAQVAIASVASSKNLSVVVDKRIVIVGGQDITKDVTDLLSGVGDPVPPVSTPPPSAVGYVDQAQIDGLPKIKAANDDFAKFRADQQKAAQDRMKSAKNDTERQAVMTDFQKAMADQQKKSLDPLVDQTRSVIADVAKKRGLILVIDKGNLIYGGTDITSDVTAALK